MVREHNYIHNIEEPAPTLSMNPLKFALWLFIITIIMIFAALTSAYIVRAADGGWLEFKLPDGLLVNTIILLTSSATMHWGYLAAKKNNLGQVKIAVLLTTILGIVFLVGQILVKQEVELGGIGFTSNPSVSFLYVLAGVHGFHLITGVIFLITVLISSFKYKVHSKNLTKIEMCTTYWHFLDGLWIYLFVFLSFYNG